MKRSPEMNNFVETMSREMFGRGLNDSIYNQVCVSCGKPVIEFDDALSRKEFTMSGLCQVCQNEVFGSD